MAAETNPNQAYTHNYAKQEIDIFQYGLGLFSFATAHKVAVAFFLSLVICLSSSGEYQ